VLRQENRAITICDLHGARFSSTTQFILVILTIIFIIIIVIKPLQKRSNIDLRNRTKPKSELLSTSDIYASVTRYTMEINPVYLSAQKHSLWKWNEHYFGTNIFATFRWSNPIHSRSLFYFHKVLTISRNIESIFLTIWKEIAVQLNFSHLKERFNRFQNLFTDFLCRSWYKRIIMHSAILG
jgi:hypothetical protein